MEKTIVLEPMFEEMSIDQEKKVALQEAFDKAVLVKTTELMETYVEEKVSEKEALIKEEYEEKVNMLESSLDGYLDTVVDEFIAENAPSYEAQIQDEKAQTLLEMFDKMLKVAGVDMLKIQEEKDQLDEAEMKESAEYKVEELTEQVSDMANKLIEAKREADKFLQAGMINEMKEGLSLLEGEKFEKIASLVPFDRSQAYVEKLDTLKESIIDSRVEEIKEQDVTLPGSAFKPETIENKQAAMDFSKYV